MLSEACKLILDEIHLNPSAPGGMVEYKRTLMISFLFKFYLEVLQALNHLVCFHLVFQLNELCWQISELFLIHFFFFFYRILIIQILVL